MNDEHSKLDKDISAKFLLKFSLPTILSMIFMSVFGIIDGVFVSRIIDPAAMAPVSIVFPFLMFALAIGFMIGVGGNALAAKKIGMGEHQKAREIFTLISVVAFSVSVVMSSISIIAPTQVLSLLGADYTVYAMALEYMIPISWMLPVMVMGAIFQQFFMTEGKAHVSMVLSLIGGLANVGLNWLLIYYLQMGLMGAAVATGIGSAIPSVIGFFYFIFNKKGTLYFVSPKWDLGVLVSASINGSSEFVTMMSVSITSIFMNNISIRIDGLEAVAAIGIIFGTMQILMSLFIGYSSGILPLISFNFGKDNTERLKQIYSKSLVIIGIISVLSLALAWIFTDAFIRIYVEPGNRIYDLAIIGFRIITASFLLMGYNSFGSVLFTALNNGKISALLSFSRTLVFVIILLLILPEIFGLYGVFIAMPAAEILAIVVTFYFLNKMKPRYKYGNI